MTIRHFRDSGSRDVAAGVNSKKARQGDRAGFYSIRINKQYRIVFTFANGEASHVEILDYHD